MVIRYKEVTKTVLLDIINSSQDFKVFKKTFESGLFIGGQSQ